MVTLSQRSLVLTCAPKNIKDRPLLSLALAAQAPLSNCNLRLLQAHSREAQTAARAVQDLALPSLASKNNCLRSPPFKLPPTPGAFPAPEGL